MGRQVGHQRGLGQAGLRVDLQHDELARTSGAVVVSKVRTAYAAAAERHVRPQSQLLDIDGKYFL